MKLKKILVMILVVTLAFGMIGCSGNAANSSSTGNDSSANGKGNEEVVDTKRDDVIVGLLGEPLGLDPQNTSDGYSNVVELQIYDGLVKFDENREVVPCIAESWEISDDALTYTFKIKEGVKFHDGTEVTVEDVKYTFDLASVSPQVSSLNIIDHVDIVDENHVAIVLKEPFFLFMEKLTNSSGSGIVSKAAREAAGPEAFMLEPMGAGPYKIKEWAKGEKIILEAFDDYHMGRAPISEVTLRFLPEPTTATLSVEAGEIDYTANVSTADLTTIDTEKVSIYENIGYHFNFLIFNGVEGPFADVKVRQAMAHAIDKESCIIASLEGYAAVAETAVRKDAAGFSADVEPRTYDPEKAKELLAEAGYSNGFETEIYAIGGYSSKLAEMIQSNLKDIGVELVIQNLEPSAFLQDVGTGNFQMAWFAMDNSTRDAIQLAQLVQTGAPYNASGYSNAEIDKSFDIISTNVDPAIRNPEVAKIQKAVNDDVPLLPLFWRTELVIAHKDLKGVENTFNTFRINELSW